MFRKKKKSSRFYRRREQRQKSSKFLEFSIIFLTLILLIYGFSFLKKISQSKATIPPTSTKELIFVRTQILNGSQKEGLAQRLANRLREMRVDNIVYDIIQTGNSEYSETKESLILDRTKDEKEINPSQVALLTAQALGVDKKNVLCKKLENNYQEIALTIVIGKDYQKLFSR